MTEDIKTENLDIYMLGKGSQCKYYMRDLKCSACFNFIANLEGKACMLCDIFIIKLKHLQKKTTFKYFFLNLKVFFEDFPI